MSEMPTTSSTGRTGGLPSDVLGTEPDDGQSDGDDHAGSVGDIDRTLEEALVHGLSPAAPRDLAGVGGTLPLRGSLSETGLPVLLGAAYRGGASGRLLVEGHGQQHAVDLDCGWPVTVTSTDPERGLAALLMRQGRLSAAERDRLRGEAMLSGRRPGAIAVELGFLKSSELLPALRKQQEEILLAALSLTEGSFSFDPESRADPAQIQVHRHPLSLVRTVMETLGESEKLVKALGGEGARLCLVGGVTAMEQVDQVATNLGDRRSLALFDGIRPLGEVIRHGHLPERSALALAFALWVGGHLVVLDQAQGRRLLRDRGLDRERLLARAALARAGDYFEVLGLLPEAEAAEIARAVAQIEGELRAAAELPGQDEIAEDLVSVRRSVEEAARVLGDEQLRARYRAALTVRPGFERPEVSPTGAVGGAAGEGRTARR